MRCKAVCDVRAQLLTHDGADVGEQLQTREAQQGTQSRSAIAGAKRFVMYEPSCSQTTLPMLVNSCERGRRSKGWRSGQRYAQGRQGPRQGQEQRQGQQ